MHLKPIAAAAIAALLASSALAETKAFTAADRAKALAAAAKARKVFDAELRDYPSARFRDVTADKAPIGGGIWFCGYVNARNAFGAYQGWRRFSASPENLLIETPDEGFSVVAVVCDQPERHADTRDYSAEITHR